MRAVDAAILSPTALTAGPSLASGRGETPLAHELPMRMPAANTNAPPTTTCNTLVANGLSM